MADSKKSESGIIDKYFANRNTEPTNEEFLVNFESVGKLSDAELKFLALSKEKKNYARIIETILSEKITLDNYEKIFLLDKYQKIGGTINPEQVVRNIRYRDRHGTIVATVQIDSINKKIRIQNFGDILPKQECFTLKHVGEKLKKLAEYSSWTTEDGGVNQFNGNMEYRYKDSQGNVMAAIVTKPNGEFDTIAEYQYNKDNFRTQMFLTNHYGQSIVAYDGSSAVIQLSRIDIDTDGMIVEITKIFSD